MCIVRKNCYALYLQNWKKSKGALMKLNLMDVNEQEMNSTTHKNDQNRIAKIL